uniref:hypothetical protein n=1 Tax=uncultured Sphingomonas sp. TaxID=158754 RepID=UPI0025FEC94C|nr:hypothetical protein [uncultured Sphingomonas sp.]
MSLERFLRFNVRSTAIICSVIAVVAALMWLATAADHLLGLRWGWDFEIIWIAPIVGGGALLVRTLARAVFRTVGAID